MTNFIQKTHLDIGFSDFNCLLDSQCSLLTSQILGRCIKLKWSNRAYAVYWLCGTLLCPWSGKVKIMHFCTFPIEMTQMIVSHLPGRHLPPPKFGHLPPPNSDISHPQKKTFARRTTATPNFFSSFFGALFLAFSTYSSWRTLRMGRRRCLTRWSWSTSSRRCLTS